jgi:type II secretory pathway pseudopilin PulG
MKRHKDKRCNHDGGVSLIELILAIGVFVISSAAVAHLFIGSQTSMNYSLEKLQAIFLAKQGIEENRAVRNVDFTSLGLGTSTETVVLNDKEYERTINISYPYADRAEILSTVEWESIGRQEIVSYREVLTKWEVIEESAE